jgi:hypothetical protein
VKTPTNFICNELDGAAPTTGDDLTHNGPPQPTAKYSAEELTKMGYHGVYRVARAQGGAENPACACSKGGRCDTGLAVPVGRG